MSNTGMNAFSWMCILALQIKHRSSLRLFYNSAWLICVVMLIYGQLPYNFCKQKHYWLTIIFGFFTFVCLAGVHAMLVRTSWRNFDRRELYSTLFLTVYLNSGIDLCCLRRLTVFVSYLSLLSIVQFVYMCILLVKMFKQIGGMVHSLVAKYTSSLFQE